MPRDGAPRGSLATGFASYWQQRAAAITTPILRVTRSQRSSTSSHLRANRPQAHCFCSTHNGPPTSHGGSPHVQQHAQACCEPLTLALGPEAQGPRHATSCREMALPGDLWPPASPVTGNNALLQLRLQYFALPVANDHQLLLICGLIVLKHIAFAPPTTDLRPRTGARPTCSSTPRRAANL